MDPKIFISFSGEEEELANALVQLLKEGRIFGKAVFFLSESLEICLLDAISFR